MMPAHGDQYRNTPATVNPFISHPPHVTEYTAQEIATLQSRLERQLGPEYISTRPGNGGGKVHYLAAEKVINLANEVFGFNGWSSAIQNVQIDFVDENASTGRINLGLSAIMRVTLRDGTFHEDIGYGHCENIKGKAAAFEKAKKEAATDALKRALRNFGNVLGNCLYDKDYLQKVTKVKVAPSKWDAENLHRHPDFAPIKREAIADKPSEPTHPRSGEPPTLPSAASASSAEFEDDFGANVFDESDFDHPDEVTLDENSLAALGAFVPKPALAPQNIKPNPGPIRTNSIPVLRPPNNPNPMQKPPNFQQQQQDNSHGPPMNPSANTGRAQGLQTPGNQQRHNQQQPDLAHPNANSRSYQQSPKRVTNSDEALQRQRGLPPVDSALPTPQPAPEHVPEGFVMGSKAELLNRPAEARPPNAALKFNPHAESPSIRRTHGINPGKSAPVSRMQIQGGSSEATPAQQTQQPGTTPLGAPPAIPVKTEANFINPGSDANRRIGMPQSGPLGPGNRASYRPPSAVKRTAMSDVTNIPHTDGASDVKKVKLLPEPDNADSTTITT